MYEFQNKTFKNFFFFDTVQKYFTCSEKNNVQNKEQFQKIKKLLHLVIFLIYIRYLATTHLMDIKDIIRNI